MAGLGGADEVVVGDVEQLPHLAEASRGAVGPFERCDALGFGGALDLQPVLVGAGEEEHVVAVLAAPPGQRVGRDRGVRRADVGHVVHVVDRRRHIEGLGHGSHCRVPASAGRTAFRPGHRSVVGGAPIDTELHVHGVGHVPHPQAGGEQLVDPAVDGLGVGGDGF